MTNKVVTVCGSLRFWDEIAEVTERLELERDCCVLGIVPHVLKKELTPEEKARLGTLHLKKIELSDAIFVVNMGGYIGDTVKKEIEHAKKLGKEIMYLEPPVTKEETRC